MRHSTHLRTWVRRSLPVLAMAAFVACFLAAGPAQPETPRVAAQVNTRRLLNADAEPQNWLTHGRTYNEQRFSPLKQINDHNVGGLGLAWYFDLDTHRGQEATPLVVDGVMYFTTAWSKVVALNAASGKLLWSYDPKVPPQWAVNACCDVVNRGVAVWQGKVFAGTLDGRLVALDAATGKLVWQKLTIDPARRYTITGAPRVVQGKVIIGNGGAEMDARGYVSAYDAETGKLVWRFYTVPGDPAKPFEQPILAQAAKTWTGQWWKYGGGGTVWDSIVYDSELDLLYIGVGNGVPWNRRIRSPGGGDNLFLASIVALKPETGRYVWHYQETPGDVWDYDACPAVNSGGNTRERPAAQSAHAGGQERDLLCSGPRNRRPDFGSAVYLHQLGDRRGHEERAPARNLKCPLSRRSAAARGARTAGRAQLAAVVLQPANRPGVHPGKRERVRVQVPGPLCHEPACR